MVKIIVIHTATTTHQISLSGWTNEPMILNLQWHFLSGCLKKEKKKGEPRERPGSKDDMQ